MINMDKLLVLSCAFFLIAVLNVSAQEERGVCVAYFTALNCEDCGLADDFMDGLINEYSETLTVIKYTVDTSRENGNVFETYRDTYGFPAQTPILLFGKNDYLSGAHEIFKNAESKIYDLTATKGIDCPLMYKYVPRSQLNPDDLPGQPEVFKAQERSEDEDVTKEDGENAAVNKTTGIVPSHGPQEIYGEIPYNILYGVLFSVAIIATISVAVFLTTRRKRLREGRRKKIEKEILKTSVKLVKKRVKKKR